MNEIIKEEKVKAFYNTMIDKKLTILCAESVTAGLLASSIASIPGSSGILKGSVVTYQEIIKEKILDVSRQILDDHSAESIETTAAMVEGLKRIDATAAVYVAVTGLASEYKDHPKGRQWGDIFVVVSYKGVSTTFSTNIAPVDGNTDYEKRNIIRAKAVVFILDKILEIVNAA